MPDPFDFLAAFGLIRGAVFSGYSIIDVNATHISLRRYHEYKYDISLELKPSLSGDTSQLMASLSFSISQKHNVLATRNYYMCSIDPIVKENVTVDPATGIVRLKLTGHATR